MNCNQCGSFGGCRCAINAAGLATAAGSGTGASPRDIGVTCEDVQDCVASMFTDIGFEYNAVTNSIVVPTGTAVDYVLTAVGDGTAVWAPPPTPTAPGVLIYDSRTWNGAASLPNSGSAGSAFDLACVAGGFNRQCTISGSGAPNWAALGGDPGDAPFSFVYKVGPSIGSDSHYAEFAFYSTANWQMDCFFQCLAAQTQVGTFIDGSYTITEIDGYTDTANAPDEGSTWVMQVNPAAYTAELYRDNVLVASASGSGFAAALTTDLVGSPDNWNIFYNGDLTDVSGTVWAGISGIAMTRTLLNSAERIAWAAYFG